MRNFTLLFATIILANIFVCCQNNKQKNNDSSYGESQRKEITEEEISIESEQEDYSEYEVSDNESFLALFPEIDTIPTSELVFSYKFDSNKSDMYSSLCHHIKYSLCGDYSQYQWYYQPLFKVKTENGFISYMIGNEGAEYSEGPELNIEDIIIITWERKDNGEYRNQHWPFKIAQRKDGEIITRFKYLNNDINSLEIVSKNEEPIQLQYIDSRFYNLKKWMLVTDEMKTPELYLSKILSQLTEIDNSWSSSDMLKINSQTKDSINRMVSLYFHRETKLGTSSISSPQEMVPVLNFLGYKTLSDSTYIIVWDSYREYSEKGELKIAFIKDLNNVVDFISFPNVNEIENQIKIIDEEIQVKSIIQDASNKTVLIPTKDGFLPKRDIIEKQISSYKDYSFPKEIDYEWTENQAKESILTPYGYTDIIGKIETNSLYIILTYNFNEITSGSHSVSIDVDGICIDKQNYKELGVFNFYFYFSDASEESLGNFKDGLLIRIDHHEDYETGEMVKRPTDTLYLTNQGMFRKYALASKLIEANIEILDHFKDLNSISDFSRYSEYEMEQIMKNQGSTEDDLFRFLYSKKYPETIIEKYIPKCIPHGKIAISDSTYVLLWQRSPAYSNQNISSEKTVMEAVVYHKSEQPDFTFINEIPLWADSYEEVLYYVNQNLENINE